MNSQADVAHVRLALVSVEQKKPELTLGDQQVEAGAAAFVADHAQELQGPHANVAGGFRVTWIGACPYCGQEAFEQTASPFGNAWRTAGACYACGIRCDGVPSGRDDTRQLGLRGYAGLWCR
jgi:hypothetical protein